MPPPTVVSSMWGKVCLFAARRGMYRCISDLGGKEEVVEGDGVVVEEEEGQGV